MAAPEHHTVNAWLSELAARAGLDALRLDDDGLCPMAYGDDLDVVIEVPAQSPNVYLYAPLLPVPPHDGEPGAALRAPAQAQLPLPGDQRRHLRARRADALDHPLLWPPDRQARRRIVRQPHRPVPRDGRGVEAAAQRRR